ncbi:MAG: M28 family peptidase [Melioribacteraceae bacterium]|nr:MAG: M28 family peptidase [Melioribacteraceae bacterium]
MQLSKKITYYLFFILVNNVFAQNPATSISIEKIQKHVSFLGSDIFEGRGTGTTGGELAAKYLAQEFSKLDIIPLGSNGTYYQYIPMHGSEPKIESRLTIYDRDENQTSLKLLNDYILLEDGDQTFTPMPLQLIFAGYGIIAPEYDYNDFQSINVEGKVVVVIEGEPTSNDFKYFDGANPTIYSLVESKKRFAISRGASGIIIIPNLIDEPNFDWAEIKTNYLFENVQLAYSVTSNLSVLLNPNIADNLFIGSQFSLNDIYDMHIKNRMMSFPLLTKISFKGVFERRDFISSNIIGMIEGKDNELKDSYMVVSAHYDHLGIGPEVNGDSVYNGVFDNAIGVSVLLEIASAIKTENIQPKRSIIFALFTGEEKGLLGSRYYVDHSPVPLYKTIANLNIDGIASFDKFNSVVGIGSEYSNLNNFLALAASQLGLSVTNVPPIFKISDAFSSSDQISFAVAGVPSILILEGIDYQNISKEKGIEKFIEFSKMYYHTPQDDLSLPINYDAVLQHSEFLMQFILAVCNSTKEPEWNENSPYLNTRLRSIAEKR